MRKENMKEYRNENRLSPAELQQYAILAGDGDQEATQIVLESLYPVLRKYARERGGSEYAEDYYQEGLVLAVKILRRKDIRKMKNFAGYFKAAYLHHLDLLEKDRRLRENSCLSFETEIADEYPLFSEFGEGSEEGLSDALSEELLDERLFEKLIRCLGNLNLSRLDSAILLTRILRCDVRRSADFLNMTTATYYYHLRQIKARFKEELSAV